MGAGACVGGRAGAAGGWACWRGAQRARGRAEQAARRRWGVGVRRGATAARRAHGVRQGMAAGARSARGTAGWAARARSLCA